MRKRKTESPDDTGLGIPQNPVTMARLWRLERVGWAMILLIVIAAAAGATGRGWLSAASTRSASGDAVLHYERVTRLYSDTQLQVTCNAPGARHDTLFITVSRPYIDVAHVEDVVPLPVDTRLAEGGVRYGFARYRGAPPNVVVFRLQPQSAGVQRGAVGCEDEASMTFTQFVLP